jgi:hypothetical protein
MRLRRNVQKKHGSFFESHHNHIISRIWSTSTKEEEEIFYNEEF